MAILAQKLSSALQRQGLVDVRDIVREVMADLVADCGGCELYVPRRFDDIDGRNAAIRQAYNGRNAHELADRFGLSMRHVLRIVRR